MDSSTAPKAMKKPVRLPAISVTGRRIMQTTASTVPTRINGVRRPKGVRSLSDSMPNRGRSIRASTLSIAMTTPVHVSPR